MKNDTKSNYIASMITFTTSAISNEETAQIILLILGIISTAISILISIWKVYKDYKITKELKLEIINENIEKLKEEWRKEIKK